MAGRRRELKLIADHCFISADTVNGHIKNIIKNCRYILVGSSRKGDKWKNNLTLYPIRTFAGF